MVGNGLNHRLDQYGYSGFERANHCRAVDGPHRACHSGYAVSQRIRKRVEEIFGWAKVQAGYDKMKVRGCSRAEAVFTFAITTYNLIRIPKLLGAVP
jgi:Transposase DDE domain